MLSLRKTKTKTATKDMQSQKQLQKISSKYNFLYVYFSNKPEFKPRAAYFRAKTVQI